MKKEWISVYLRMLGSGNWLPCIKDLSCLVGIEDPSVGAFSEEEGTVDLFEEEGWPDFFEDKGWADFFEEEGWEAAPEEEASWAVFDFFAGGPSLLDLPTFLFALFSL